MVQFSQYSDTEIISSQKPLMTASSRNDDEVVSFRDTSRKNDAEMVVSKGFPTGRSHSAHLLRYGSSMMGGRQSKALESKFLCFRPDGQPELCEGYLPSPRRQALHLNQM